MENKDKFQKEVLSMVQQQELTPKAASFLLKYSNQREKKSEGSKKIAVIGLSCAFPGAKDSIDFWNNMKEGKDSVSDFEGRWKKEDCYSENAREPGKTNNLYGGVLDDIYEFDPEYFNLTPKEAMLMDPQQRLFLMHAVKTFEDAGYARIEIAEIVSKVLDSLSDTNRYIFRQRFLENRSQADIAKELGVSQMTVSRA